MNIIKKKAGEDYAKGIMRFFSGDVKLNFIKKESLYNQFYSDLVTKLPHHIENKGTTVHCMYATEMGEEYLERYQLFFNHPDIYTMSGLQHEELLLCQPEKWVKVIEKFVLANS